MRTSKLMWNSTIGTRDVKYMVADAENFYLVTPLEQKKYLRIAVNLTPKEFIDLYGLQNKVKST